MTKKVLQETQVFGPVYSYIQYTETDELIIEVCENYQKKTYRNRYRLLTSNGITTLSIPLKKGKNNQTPISEVLIAYDEPWHLQHLQTIRSAYGRSAYFEYYFPEIEEILMLEKSHLLDLNDLILKFFLKRLKLTVRHSHSENYEKSTVTVSNHVTDFRNHKVPSDYTFISYPQVWSDRFEFVPNLSILDLLFCMGHEAQYILKNLNFVRNNNFN